MIECFSEKTTARHGFHTRKMEGIAYILLFYL